MLKEMEGFLDFLVRAKHSTYAGNGPLTVSSRLKSKDLEYREGEFYYLDTYLGDLDFIGEEAVWFAGKPIWGMNYSGRMLTADIPQDFIPCLKAALRELSVEAPYRGPQEFRLGNLLYRCSWQGDLEFFSGRETISTPEQGLYELVFHGGKIRSFTAA